MTARDIQDNFTVKISLKVTRGHIGNAVDFHLLQTFETQFSHYGCWLPLSRDLLPIAKSFCHTA